jgi:hypothetical protein
MSGAMHVDPPWLPEPPLTGSYYSGIFGEVPTAEEDPMRRSTTLLLRCPRPSLHVGCG